MSQQVQMFSTKSGRRESEAHPELTPRTSSLPWNYPEPPAKDIITTSSAAFPEPRIVTIESHSKELRMA